MNIRNILFYPLVVGLCIGTGCVQEPVVGGFANVPPAKKEVQDAVAFAIQAQGKAMQGSESTPTTQLELVSILDVEEQVVAGMNYKLKLQVTVNGEQKLAEAVVWWQAWRKPEPYQLTSWQWNDQ